MKAIISFWTSQKGHVGDMSAFFVVFILVVIVWLAPILSLIQLLKKKNLTEMRCSIGANGHSV
jgi:hypothetical protein